MKKSLTFAQCVVAVAVLCLAGRVPAAPLGPGQTLFPAPGETDPVGGTVIAGGVALPIVAPTFSGSLTTSVIAGDTSNPHGGLTFTFRLTNDAGSANVISHLAIPGLIGYLVDASYRSPGTGTPPATIERATTGDAVGFSFLAGLGPGPLSPGSSSALLVLQTNAQNFGASIASVIDGSVGEVSSFVPSVPADFNHDRSVDLSDFAVFKACATGPNVAYNPAALPSGCTLTADAGGRIAADFDRDRDVDMDDFGVFQRCHGGPNRPAHPSCAG